MTALLIAPHADDETLFAAYLAQRYAAVVAVVYDEGRVRELARATSWLGCRRYRQLQGQKGDDDEQDIEEILCQLRDPVWDLVIAPAEEVEGHDEHNIVSRASANCFEGIRRIEYTTYAPRGRRTRGREESFPTRPEHVARKLAALSCYRSQIADPDTGPWFYSLLDMREWVA